MFAGRLRFLSQIALVVFAFVQSAPLSASGRRPDTSDPASAMQRQTKKEDKQAEKKPDEPKKDDEKKEEEPKNELKPYEKVIPKTAQSQEGLLTIHHVEDNWFLELKPADFERPFLIVTRIENGPANVDRGQFLQTEVLWELDGKKVYLREAHFDILSSDPNATVNVAVKRSSVNPIMLSFAVEAKSKTGNVVIDIAKLLNGDVPGIGLQTLVRAGARDTSRSFIQNVRVFPTNLEVQSVATFNGGGGNPALGGSSSITLGVHYSIVALPSTVMKARLADDRVGFFGNDVVDYGQKSGGPEKLVFINRWRLEKKNPNEAVSDVVKPIVFYIDPATPAQWVPYIQRAVEAWQPAFEAAGFRHAIEARLAPTAQQDPTWSVEDVRYSVIRWLPSTTTNAIGPHISDPRSGEILNAPVVIYQNVIDLVTRWYFAQASPLDPRAQSLPFPTDLTGALLQSVVEHEVGHSLGLMHNFKASSLYTIAQIRDPKWVREMGFAPSIMDYARFNYVAQPEDGMTAADLLPRIGPYDRFAIHWGYAPVVTASTPEDERPTLNTWAEEPNVKPYLRFAPDDSVRGVDPGEDVEAIGDIDSVAATTLGLKNLHRVMGYLLPATSARPGYPYRDLKTMFNAVGRQWATELDHVDRIVAGAQTVNRHEGDAGLVYTPLPRERQREAVQFLLTNAFERPDFIMDPAVTFRIEPSGMLERISGVQAGILGDLISSTRVLRLTEWQTRHVADSYSPTEFLTDVRKGVWREIYAPGTIRIDPFRQNLQRAWVETVTRQINSAAGPYYRGEALALIPQLKAALLRTSEPTTKHSFEDALYRLVRSTDTNAGTTQLAPVTPPPPTEPTPQSWFSQGNGFESAQP